MCKRGWGHSFITFWIQQCQPIFLLTLMLWNSGKKLKICFSNPQSLHPYSHTCYPLFSKKRKRKTTDSAFAVILSCVGVPSGIAAKSRKVLATAHCIGDYLEASQGQSQTLANCHRCNCFEKQVSSPLTSCRKMKMGNTVIFYSVSSCSF